MRQRLQEASIPRNGLHQSCCNSPRHDYVLSTCVFFSSFIYAGPNVPLRAEQLETSCDVPVRGMCFCVYRLCSCFMLPVQSLAPFASACPCAKCNSWNCRFCLRILFVARHDGWCANLHVLWGTPGFGRACVVYLHMRKT